MPDPAAFPLAPYSGRAPASLEHAPGPLNIAVESRHRIAVGDADDGLGGKVDHDAGLIFADGAFEQVAVADVAADELGLLITVGFTGQIFFHVYQNIGMTIALMPITGIPMPLISYGGTFLVMVMFGLGPTYVFLLQYRAPLGLMRAGWTPWLSTMSTNAAVAAQRLTHRHPR